MTCHLLSVVSDVSHSFTLMRTHCFVLAAGNIGNVEVSPWHIAEALLSIKGGVPERLCARLKVNATIVRVSFHAKVRSLPKQVPAPAKPDFGAGAQRVLQLASALQRNKEASHMALDDVFLALVKDREVGPELESLGIGPDELEEEVNKLTASLRSFGDDDGAEKLSGEHTEELYEALKTYGIDLVSLAEEGKLDPVIGRDTGRRLVCAAIPGTVLT